MSAWYSESVLRKPSLLFAFVMLVGCTAQHASVRLPETPPARQPPLATGPDVELAESFPLETTLDHPEIPDAPDVWLRMMNAATRSIDLAEFYVSDAAASRLHAVLDAVEHAAERGVHVRLLVDQSFYAKYPEVPDAWAKRANMEVRRIDLKPGVLHAKYFVVDGVIAYAGSQNFDWRSLDHIVELGARVRTPNAVAALAAIFRADWDVAGGGAFHLDVMRMTDKIDGGAIIFGASPKSMVPESMWDLPRLLAWIGETQTVLRIQLLTYKTKNRDGSDFHDIDDAVRAAVKRGVRVELLISTWGEKDPAVAALAALPDVEVRVLAIPPFSSGEIPFARVAHTKLALFDEGRAWVGTSNWEGDYFLHSRNVGFFFEHASTPGKVARYFAEEWRSPYARPLTARSTP